MRLLQRDLLHAPVTARQEQRLILPRDAVDPPAAGPDRLLEGRRLAGVELVDVDRLLAPPAGRDEGAVAFDGEQPAPAAVGRNAAARAVRVRDDDRVEIDA